MPDVDVNALETRYPGWIQRQIDSISANTEARLAKRYNTPLASPYPEVVISWVVALVTVRCYIKRGVDPSDPQFELIKEEASTAQLEILEAANSETGLFEIPLRNDVDATGVARGGPYCSSEQSPYVWADQQREVGRWEDSNGRGSRG